MAIREYAGKGGKYRAYFKHQEQQYSKVFQTKAEAKAWEVEKKKELQQSETMPWVLMFSSACEEYLEDYKVRFQHNSFREKQCHLREFAGYLGKDTEMENIVVHVGKSFMLKLQKEKGNKTANRRLKSLKALWNWHKGRLQTNPWENINPYHEDEFIKYVPSKEDVHKVLSVADAWEKRFLEVLIHSGARLGEIINLVWDDVNFDAKTFQLWTRKRKGGSKQRRILPLDATLLSIFKELKNEAKEDEKSVFINMKTGAKYSRQQPSIDKMLSRLCNKAEVNVFTFHAIRHYFANSLMKAGSTCITDIQLLLGHQRTTTTDIYLRSMSPQLGHLAEIIEKAVKE